MKRNLRTLKTYSLAFIFSAGLFINNPAMASYHYNIGGKPTNEKGEEVNRGVIGQIKDKAGVALAETEFAKHNAKADEILKNPGKYTAEEDINQKGSYVVSEEGNISYEAGGDVRIEAAANTYKERTTHEEYTDTATYGNSTLSASHSQNKSKSEYDSVAWSNSGVYAESGTVSIKSGGDTTVRGGNILGEDVALEAGGSLTVESLQDEIHADNSGSGFNIGGGSSVSFGLNNSSGYTDMAWVNNQTSIVGTNSIDIEADKTHVIGAVIANINQEGTDGGNLTLKTNELTYENIEDYYESENKSSGINITVGNMAGTLSGQEFPKGSAGFNLASSGEEKEQITRGTIGEGKIVIAGETQAGDSELLASLNRDITKSQEITKDELTGGLDAGLTIDLRLLDPTGEGQKEIWRELTGLPQNLVTTAMYGTQAAVTMGVIAADAMVTAVDNIDGKIQITTKDETGKEVKIEVDPERGLIGQIKDKTGIALAETEFAKHNAKADEILKNPGKYTAEEVTKAEATRDAYYKQYGVSEEDYKATVYAKHEGETYVDENGQLKYRQGGYVEDDHKGGTNLIDANGKIIDGKTMKEVGVHEGMHGLGYGENYAEAMGDYAAERNGLFTIFGAGYGSSGTSGNEWLNQGTLNYNGGILNLNSQPVFESNAEYLASNNQYFTEHGPEATDNKVYIVARDLDMGRLAPATGRHAFIIAIPDNPEDFTQEKLDAMGLGHFKLQKMENGEMGIVLGAYDKGNLEAQTFQKFDTEAANLFLQGKSDIRHTPKGGEIKTNLPDTQYIYNFLINFDNYQQNTANEPLKYPSMLKNAIGGIISEKGLINSNTFARDLAVTSAGGMENVISMPKRSTLWGNWYHIWPIPGYGNTIPNNLFSDPTTRNAPPTQTPSVGGIK